MYEIPRESRGEAPAQVGASLSIGEVARISGIAVDTLRAWERRYGRPSATRLPSGHRRYTSAQAAWIQRVAEGIARGYRPSKLLALGDDELTALLGEPTAVLDASARLLLGHLRAYRRAEIVDLVRRDWRQLEPRRFLEERLSPLLDAVGRLWAEGRLEIRHEHFLVEVLEDVLRVLRMSLPATVAERPLVLTTLSGETHRIALLMLSLLATMHGRAFHLLGADTPATEIAAMVRETDACAVVVSVSLATGGVEMDRRLAALRAMLPEGVALVTGGAGTRGPRRTPRGVVHLEDLAAFEAWLHTDGERSRP